MRKVRESGGESEESSDLEEEESSTSSSELFLRALDGRYGKDACL